LLRVLLDAVVTSRRDQAKLQAEVLALRRQVQVLERQINRVKWTQADRMVLAALRDRLPRSAWAALRVQPEQSWDGIAISSADGGQRTGIDLAWVGRRSRRNAASS
jgi:hypothetical protein